MMKKFLWWKMKSAHIELDFTVDIDKLEWKKIYINIQLKWYRWKLWTEAFIKTSIILIVHIDEVFQKIQSNDIIQLAFVSISESIDGSRYCKKWKRVEQAKAHVMKNQVHILLAQYPFVLVNPSPHSEFRYMALSIRQT